MPLTPPLPTPEDITGGEPSPEPPKPNNWANPLKPCEVWATRGTSVRLAAIVEPGQQSLRPVPAYNHADIPHDRVPEHPHRNLRRSQHGVPSNVSWLDEHAPIACSGIGLG